MSKESFHVPPDLFPLLAFAGHPSVFNANKNAPTMLLEIHWIIFRGHVTERSGAALFHLCLINAPAPHHFPMHLSQSYKQFITETISSRHMGGDGTVSGCQARIGLCALWYQLQRVRERERESERERERERDRVREGERERKRERDGERVRERKRERILWLIKTSAITLP